MGRIGASPGLTVPAQAAASATEALLAQWLERAAVNRKVTGSIPVGSVTIFVLFALRTVLVGSILFREGSVA